MLWKIGRAREEPKGSGEGYNWREKRMNPVRKEVEDMEMENRGKE